MKQFVINLITVGLLFLFLYTGIYGPYWVGQQLDIWNLSLWLYVKSWAYGASFLLFIVGGVALLLSLLWAMVKDIISWRS